MEKKETETFFINPFSALQTQKKVQGEKHVGCLVGLLFHPSLVYSVFVVVNIISFVFQCFFFSFYFLH